MELVADSAVEAIRMVERGDATPEDVDLAMELGAGYRESSALSIARLLPLLMANSHGGELPDGQWWSRGK
jgi:3-hydroxyacyl-CoA dehydrogenase